MDGEKDCFQAIAKEKFYFFVEKCVLLHIIAGAAREFYVFPCLDYNIEDDNLKNLLLGTIVQAYHPVQSSTKN